MDKVLIAMKNYDAAKKALSLKDRATVKVGDLTIEANDIIKECIEDMLKYNYHKACRAYHDELDRLATAIWEEYMNSFTS